MGLSNTDVDNLVLSTVNAPYSKRLDEKELLTAIRNTMVARQFAGPVSSFFYDVPVELQKQFANSHGMSESVLAEAAKSFAKWSGKPWPGAMIR